MCVCVWMCVCVICFATNIGKKRVHIISCQNHIMSHHDIHVTQLINYLNQLSCPSITKAQAQQYNWPGLHLIAHRLGNFTSFDDESVMRTCLFALAFQCPQWQLVTWLKCRVKRLGASPRAVVSIAMKWSTSGIPRWQDFDLSLVSLSPSGQVQMNLVMYMNCRKVHDSLIV